MTSMRLHEILDLVCACNYQAKETDGEYSVTFRIGRWDTYIFINDALGKIEDNHSTVYSECPYDGEVEDPDFIKAEEHIKRLMEGKNDESAG